MSLLNLLANRNQLGKVLDIVGVAHSDKEKGQYEYLPANKGRDSTVIGGVPNLSRSNQHPKPPRNPRLDVADVLGLF